MKHRFSGVLLGLGLAAGVMFGSDITGGGVVLVIAAAVMAGFVRLGPS